MPHLPARTRRGALCLFGAAALLAASLGAIGAGTAGASGPKLTKANVGAFSGILTLGGRSLYVLSAEKGAKLKCAGTCLKTWVPLEVASSVKSVAVGPGVAGKVGFVKRSSKDKQVTFNTYPLYTYVHDSTRARTSGEAVAANGGRWDLVHAAASKPSSTSYVPLLQAANEGSFHGVLQIGSSSLSLYLLTDEQGASLKCTSAECLHIWPPLLVPSSTTAITLGAGVKGTIGFVARSGAKQVTYNSFPLYTYYTDTANTTQGQGIQADGGTWYLVSAAATTAADSPVT